MAWLSGSGRTATKRRKWKPEQKALIVLEGTVLSRCMQRHRHQECLRWLNTIKRTHPSPPLDLPLHADLLLLGQRRRDPLRHAYRRRLQRGALHSLVDLQAEINR